MPIGGLLIGMTDAQGHGFVIAATYNLERQRQSDRRATICQRQGAHLHQIAEARVMWSLHHYLIVAPTGRKNCVQ
jgi:hypothetical protein